VYCSEPRDCAIGAHPDFAEEHLIDMLDVHMHCNKYKISILKDCESKEWVRRDGRTYAKET